jgi:CRISPR-associated endonuclease/helicase Cas3
MDDGDDLPSRSARKAPVALADHLDHTRRQLEDTLALLPLPHLQKALQSAIRLHDWGKADERFQALLINGDLDDAWAQGNLWAKSGNMSTTEALRKRARKRSSLPDGFRHEMLSVQLAEMAPEQLPADGTLRELALHLIAAHHGRGRPFAPVVFDEDPPKVDLGPIGVHTHLTSEQRRQCPSHRLDSGIAERFWDLTRHYGWWGLAYLEAVVRLADQRASQREDEAEREAAGQPLAEVMP